MQLFPWNKIGYLIWWFFSGLV